ncbi:MAG: DUF3305 domain-containing protein [Betaproteobacteria bacterium]|nr:DUF3305 domain-containing protein [Betaproteobacteria bacterium]
MQRRALQNRWQNEAWEPWSVLESEEPEGAARLLVDEPGIAQWLHPGFELTLHRDEAEGYYMNVSADEPRVFVLWRMEGDRGIPLQVTASYDEGGRWLDGGHSVDSVPMPPEIFAWVGEFVEMNYRPEPKQRIKPRSFVHPKDRVGR